MFRSKRWLPEKYLLVKQKKTAGAGGLSGTNKGMNHGKHGACGVNSLVVCSRDFGSGGPSKAGTPAAGAGVCLPG